MFDVVVMWSANLGRSGVDIAVSPVLASTESHGLLRVFGVASPVRRSVGVAMVKTPPARRVATRARIWTVLTRLATTATSAAGRLDVLCLARCASGVDAPPASLLGGFLVAYIGHEA
ncbi:MAG: hypothetical protein HYR62_07785 [Actinobacteria bacterium]|nr:hypothetical protein [Actinomycetota bacterium]MBI3687586.1 hypothetical protein [Actinomycetota bacterium]